MLANDEDGILSGGMSGALAGAAVGGPIGAGVGLAAGGIIGGIMGSRQRNAQRRAMQEAEQARARALFMEFGRRQQAEQTQLAMLTRRPAQNAGGASGSNNTAVNSTTGFIGGAMPSQNSSGSSGTF